MKTRTALTIGLAALLLAWLARREVRLAEEVATLRATVQRIEDTHSSSPDPTRFTLETPPPQSTPALVADAHLSERVAELERDLEATIDSHNRTVDELTRLLAVEKKARMRSWGPEQATGEPDTMSAGDQTTAWAPAAADGGIEWLQMRFDAPVDLAEVRVRETCNPGAITKVIAQLESGGEVVIWQGREAPAAAPIDRPFRVPPGVRAAGVRVEVDTRLAPGWEEIDAIALVGRDGAVHWGAKATASSSYADGSRNALGFDSSGTLHSYGIRFGDRPADGGASP